MHLCKIWEDIENQDVLPLCLEEKKFGIFSLRFRSSGKEILCGANGGDIYVYDLECNKKTLSVCNAF